MTKSIIQLIVGGCISCTLLYSCDGNGGKQFSTKEDSLAFARSVLQTYPDQEQPIASASQDTTKPAKGRSYQQQGPGGFAPIDWKTVELYRSNYDKNPQLKSPQGYFYKGFSIDASGYATLLKTSSIKGLYLRLGKKEDGSYTIMVLGMDAKGNIINSGVKATEGDDDTNFDNVRTCPENCPPQDPGE